MTSVMKSVTVVSASALDVVAESTPPVLDTEELGLKMALAEVVADNAPAVLVAEELYIEMALAEVKVENTDPVAIGPTVEELA